MKYEEIKIGDIAELFHEITSADIEKFVELTGDDNKLHINETFAKTTHFKKPVVHGMLGASFISTIIGTKLPGDGALWFSQSLEFLLPVRVGDYLRITAEVVKKIESEKIIELKTDIYNQNKQLVTRGISKVKVIEPEPIKKQLIIDKKESTKVALVIGSTGAIGFATCIQLAKDGFDIIIHYNKNIKQAEEIKTEVEKINRKAILIKANIVNEDEIKELITKSLRSFEKIDVLVNCAATVIPNIRFEDLDWSDFLKQLEFTIKSTMLIIQNVLPSMLQNSYGKIITIGSFATDKPNNQWSHYITAKSALIGLTKSLALEFAPKGIHINMVSPSLLDSELTADIPEKTKLLTAAQTPLRRLATSYDVAGAISFLASEKSDFLAGENIRINGGQIML